MATASWAAAQGQLDPCSVHSARQGNLNPAVIAKAPTRFLVSGMGDALSTYFEARATRNSYSNVNAGLPCGAREEVCAPAKGTNTAFALAKLCYETLLAVGKKAKHTCDANMVSQALENIV